MASVTHCGDFGLCGDRAAPLASGAAAKLKRLAGRLNGALEVQRRKAFDRQIGGLLARSGGRLTDSLEREIMRKMFASDWSSPE